VPRGRTGDRESKEESVQALEEMVPDIEARRLVETGGGILWEGCMRVERK